MFHRRSDRRLRFNQRIKEKEGVTENLLKTVVLTLYVLYKTLLRGEFAAEQGFYRKKKGKKTYRNMKKGSYFCLTRFFTGANIIHEYERLFIFVVKIA